ncbi:MAG TPA: PRC-barrel domain-containing protein [Methanobacteriaceae archaeon]|nr:PRC-barrel domain-containing protein [Methanobacteriaceae archaeon]
MKASEFIGKTVIDQKGQEIGKITDIILKPKDCLIDKVLISDGGVLSKKYFTITEKEIDAIGDYVIVKMSKTDTKERIDQEDVESLKNVELNFKKLVGKTVITSNGVELGTVEDIMIQPKECLMENLVVKAKSELGKKSFTLENNEIADIKYYLILKIDFDSIEERIID